jgi:NAD(P)-dependent dehydrogenase (short-subunit alcohol dehydrogenase family)
LPRIFTNHVLSYRHLLTYTTATMSASTTGSMPRTLAHVLHSNLCITLPIPEATPGLSKQTIIVTGSNIGLGYESSLHLLRLGVGKLIMAVRDVIKGEAAREELLRATGRKPETIEVWKVDMSNYASVKDLAARANQLPRLDAVLANAGMATRTFSVAEGFEQTLTINVIATFLLFLLVLPKLREAPSTGRFVIPNSALHYVAPISEIVPAVKGEKGSIYDALNDKKAALMGQRYPLSKLLVVYMIRELTEQIRASGKPGVILNTPNPSACKSQLMREYSWIELKLGNSFARTAEMGSRALVNGVLGGEDTHGQYLDDCKVAE